VRPPTSRTRVRTRDDTGALARGHYCQKEHQQHLELAAFYPKIAVGYTQIATIATDTHHTLQEFRASVGAQWPDNDPMIPHTLVLKAGPDRPPHLHGLLVLGAAVGGRPWSRPAPCRPNDPRQTRLRPRSGASRSARRVGQGGHRVQSVERRTLLTLAIFLFAALVAVIAVVYVLANGDLSLQGN
jgi:hypothetical protein